MAKYLLIKNGVVANVVVIEKQEALEYAQANFDYVIDVESAPLVEVFVSDPENGDTNQLQKPQIGWTYNGQEFSPN